MSYTLSGDSMDPDFFGSKGCSNSLSQELKKTQTFHHDVADDTFIILWLIFLRNSLWFYFVDGVGPYILSHIGTHLLLVLQRRGLTLKLKNYSHRGCKMCACKLFVAAHDRNCLLLCFHLVDVVVVVVLCTYIYSLGFSPCFCLFCCSSVFPHRLFYYCFYTLLRTQPHHPRPSFLALLRQYYVQCYHVARTVCFFIWVESKSQFKDLLLNFGHGFLWWSLNLLA